MPETKGSGEVAAEVARVAATEISGEVTAAPRESEPPDDDPPPPKKPEPSSLAEQLLAQKKKKRWVKRRRDGASVRALPMPVACQADRSISTS